MTASTGTFVSCTDYDDDIDNLQGQIDKLAGKAELDSQVSSLSSQISAAQGAADAAKTAAAAAQAAADAAKSVADSKLDEAAVKAIAEAAAEGAAAAAKEGKDAAAVAQAAAEAAKAAADAAQATADKGVSDAEAAQKAADAAAEAAQAVAAKLADYATKAELKAAQEVAAAAAAAAQKAGLDAAQVAANAAAAAQKTADEAVAAAKKAAEDAAAAQKAGAAAAEAAAKAAEEAQKTADEAVAAAKKAQETADKVTAAQEAAGAAQATADAAQKTADEAVAAAKKAAEEAAAAKKDGAAAAEALAQAAAAAQKTADEAVAAAKKAAEDAAAAQGAAAAAQATADAAAAAAEKVATDLAALEVRVKALEAAVEAAATQEELNNLKELVDKLNEDSAEFLNIVSKRLTSLVFAPQTYIDGIETINFQTFLYADWGEYLLRDKADFKLDADGKKTEVEEDDDNAKRDEDGKYYAAADIVRIGDNSATAQYLVNPAGVTLNGIKELAYIGQDEATNQIRQTRALGAAPIKVVGKDLKDGVLTVKLSKVDQDDYLGHGFEEVVRKKFTIVSLKATLADEVLTASEKDAEVNVFSDWTRLTETVVTPYIANGQPSNRDSEDNLICGEWASHYWPFSSIYDITAEKPLEKVYDEGYYWNQNDDLWNQNDDLDYSDYIGASAVYNKPFDLMSLVTVCAGWDRENYNELKNYEEYGLEFEFHVMPYLFDNEEETVDATPQDKFAKLAEDKHTLIPTSRDGQEYNANAIGRTPVIQIVLKDKKHDDAVVDVRYTMIQWVADAPSSVVWTPAKYPDLSYEKVAFKCTGNYVNEIREKYMNNLYANIKDGGMTKSEFHSTYKKIFDKSFYAYTYTYKDANNKDVVKTYSLSEIEELLKSNDAGSELAKLRIGKAKNLYDWDEPNQTYNIQISVDADDYRLPQDDKDFTIEGFFFFENSAGTSRVIIPVEFEVVRGTLENKYKYLQTQWLGTLSKENKDKTRPANPTLISDKTLGKDAGFVTTQLISDITYGYMANGQTPDDFHDLAIYKKGTWKDGEEVEDRFTDVVFDAARLSLLPDLDDLTERDNAGNVTKTFGWAVTEDGKTLYYAAKDSEGKVLPWNDATASIAAQVDKYNNDKDKTVYLCDNVGNTTIGTADAEPTPAALRLVGCKKVPVKVVAEACDEKTVDFDQYLIWFIDPLKWTDGSQAIKLKDVENYGGEAKAISIGDQFTLEENFGSKTKLYLFDVYDAKGKPVHTKTTDLNNWYGVKNVVMADKSEWLINIDADGAINDNSSSKLQEVKNSNDEPLYDLVLLDADKVETDDIDKVKFVKYHNNSGQAITKNIVIKVPVSLDTKWKKGNTNYITVTIEPNI